MANFVLVHGAWVGGWCWRPVAQALRRSGHEVYTPTLTGLGERSHLINSNINLDTHISDVTNVIHREELSEIVLVGHSHGGMVITGVFDALSDKITSLVYLDAFVPENGQSLYNLLPFLRLVSPDGASTIAPLSAAIFGASPDVAAYAGRPHYAPSDSLLQPNHYAYRRHRSRAEENLHLRQCTGANGLHDVLRKVQRASWLDSSHVTLYAPRPDGYA